MKNILFKILPIVAAVLFATSCSKDDGNDNSVVADINTTNEPTTAPSTTTSETTNGVQVEVDENGVPYIPFSITVGQDSESLSKVSMQTDPDASNYRQQRFTEYDKIKITGTDITGELTPTDEPGMTTTFSGTLKGMGVKYLTATTKLTATLFSAKELSSSVYYYNYGTPLTEPKLFSNSDNNLVDAIEECSYLTKTFEYGSTGINLEQKTAFIKVNLQYFAARVYIDYGGKTYTIDVPGNPSVSYKTTPVIAVPDGASIRASFLTGQKDIDVSGGNVLYNINRTLPDLCIPATFSISKDEQVFFSTSNLLYGLNPDLECLQIINSGQHAIGSFRDGTVFEYDYAGQTRGYVDLFGWGSWLENKGTLPRSTATHIPSFTWTSDDPNANSQPRARANLIIDDWFTLTKDEWDYLLNKRDMANPAGLRYIRASIKTDNGKMIPGLILFPDAELNSTEHYIKSAFKGAGSCSEPYTDSFDNYIEEDEWTTFCSYFNNGVAAVKVKVPSNLVFLPAAGYRVNTTITYSSTGDNVAGYYWTSTSAYAGSSSTWPTAMKFDKDGVNFIDEGNSHGYSVRLVQAMPTTKN